MTLALGCEGPAGPPGETGPKGTPGQGSDAGPGAPGEDGDAGTPGRNAYLTGPGLKLQIVATTIDAAGLATITFRVTDDAGTPLDRAGLYTEGAVAARFVLAWLDQNAAGEALQYTSYATEVQTSPITGTSATQAAADQGGIFADVDPAQGTYTYTFGEAVVVADPTRTHTVGAWAHRDFEGKRYVANATHDFLPAGGAPTVKRDVVELQACNACHHPLQAHGGERRDVQLCVLCHTPQTTDPDTGNTVDFSVMVHKIHAGRDLPSVQGGAPYQLVGAMQQVSDYSTVAYPQELSNCPSCHSNAQSDTWKTRPSRAVCGACHDRTAYVAPTPAGSTPHGGGPQSDDSKCVVCHPPTLGLAGVDTKHLTPLFDPVSPRLALTIGSVTKTGPGAVPEIVFTVTKNGAPLDILAAPLSALTVTVAGPTTDYAAYVSYPIQGNGAVGQLVAGGALGQFRYVFPAPMDAAATGTYAFGLEGYLQPGGAAGPRFAALNPVAFAAVTDAAAVPRRTIVDGKLCNSCHAQLAAHGGQRREVQYCAFCHNANEVNDQRVSRFEGQTVTAKSLHLPVMIHAIHMGDALTQQPYVLGGFPAPSKANPAGTPIDFGQTRYPGDRMACWSCHAGKTYALPLPAGALPSKTQRLQCTEDPAADADGYCDTRVVLAETYQPPAAAACTGCHDAPYVVAHAETTTSASGVEACATCHGTGAANDVDRVHAPAP